MSLFHRSFHLAHRIFSSGGTCLEFGVFQGNTYCYQAAEILRTYPRSRLIGFDSWKGLPEETAEVWAPERHAEGEFQAPKAMTMQRLKKLGIGDSDPRFQLVDGYFSESLTPSLQATIKDLIFVNIDVDLYRSTIELLDFVRPLLRPGVVIYWDDWKDPRDQHQTEWGEHLAWEHWSSQHSGVKAETLEINSLNQRSMIVTEVDGRMLAPPLPTMSAIREYACALDDSVKTLADPNYIAYQRLKARLGAFPLVRRIARGVRGLVQAESR